MTQTVICMRWGTLYGPDYVNKLYAMLKRNTRRPLRLVCYTDDPKGVRPEVECYPLPPITLPPGLEWMPRRKISLWAPTLEGVAGDVLFLDLDIVLVGSIDDFFDYKPTSTFCVIENWTQKGEGIGNTSVYRFRVGAHAYIYERFQTDPASCMRPHYANGQTYISKTIREKDFWPEPWCVSFKHSLLPPFPLRLVKAAPLPEGVKVVCFTGLPLPPHARDGVWPDDRWYKRLYKQIRPTPWIAEHWREDAA